MTMKRLVATFLIFVGLAIVVGVVVGQGTINAPQHPVYDGKELFTAAKPWVLLRAAGDVDAASLDAAGYLTSADGMDYSTKVVNKTTVDATTGMIDVWTSLGWGANAVTITFWSVDDAANDDFDIGVFAWKDSYWGPAIPVYQTTGDACKVGTYKCLKHPTLGTAQASGLWVDTISGTDTWPTGVTVNDSANNRLCTMTFDLMGCRYVKVVIWSGAGVSPAANIGAIITTY